MEKKTLKTSVIVALLTMLGFVSSCKPEQEPLMYGPPIGTLMYGAKPTEYNAKENVGEKYQADSLSINLNDTVIIKDETDIEKP